MADAIVSEAANRLISLFQEQARHHINLVRGAEEKVQSLAVDLQTIRNVLDDAENRRFKDKSINYWLSRLEQTAYEMDDVLDEWDYALLKLKIEERRSDAVPKQKVCSFIPSSSSCLCFKKVAVRHNIGKKILCVKEKLDKILKERDQYGFVISEPSGDTLPESWRVQTTSMIDLTNVHGRDIERDLLVTKLMDVGGSQEDSGFRILSIVGTGGLGKTTLAQMVYNHNRVEEFFELRIWVCVSDPFDLVAIAKGILECIKVGSSPNSNNLEVLFKQVKESISGQKFLLVLDDVWTEDSNKWEPLENSLRCGGAGSRILVTSRSERVVRMMGSRENEICRPRLLSDDDCWLLLSRIALSGRNEVEFMDIGKNIAKKCKGLPLAAKTLGSLLRFKSSLEQWRNVLNSEIWEMGEAKVDIFPHLLLSYNELTPTLKRCFSYCAVFPKDINIGVESLIKSWMALGYLGSNIADMEIKGQEYFDALAMRSLFQDFEKDDLGEIKWCKMHDIVHDFAQFLKESVQLGANGTTCQVCDPSHVSMVNEFCTLHCEKVSLPNICNCFVRSRVLRFSSQESIPQGMEKLIHLRWLYLRNIKLSCEDLKAIFKLYLLQSLSLFGCSIEEIPKEIGNLINLRFLNLGMNDKLKKLPMEIGNLNNLKRLILYYCKSLKELPESLCDLKKLHTLDTKACDSLYRIPERLFPLLGEFLVGIGGTKLELLKNVLNSYRGVFALKIRLDGEGDLNEVIQDFRKAELMNEILITSFEIWFMDEGPSSVSCVWMDVMEALQPHPNLTLLRVVGYGGSKLPRWMVSPLNHLKNLSLLSCKHLTSLPPFGKLPCLEEICLYEIDALEIVGREFLGITTGEGEGEGEGGGDIIAFPKLKTLTIQYCRKWKEWEDITVEEEESAAFSIMPRLTYLQIRVCRSLTMLPHRLLRKVSTLKTLYIFGSTELEQRYGDKDGSDWKSISTNNPRLHLICESS